MTTWITTWHARARERRLYAYLVALVIVALAAGVQMLLWQWIHPSPFVLMILAVVLAGRDESWGPGLLATILGVGFVDLLFLPSHGPDSRDVLTLLLFAFLGVCTTWLNVALRRSARLASEQEQWLATTIRSIGDAVIATDREGRIRFMNAIAEALTGWTSAQTRKLHLDEVFKIVDEQTRKPADSPLTAVVQEGHVIGFANPTVLVSRSGEEHLIEDSSAPIRTTHGELTGVVVVFRDATPKSREQERKSILAETSAALAASLDYDTTLQRVAEVAVPRFADWCTVHLLERSGEIRMVAIHHTDPSKLELGRALWRRFPQDPSADTGLPNVIRTGRSEWASGISDELLLQASQTPEHLRLLREVGPRSYIMVPLRTRGRTLGVLTFATAESSRRYHESDIPFAEDLAERAAIAVDNSSLYTAAQDAIRLRDEFLAVASHELKTPLATLQLQLDILNESMASAMHASSRLTRQFDTAHRQTVRLGSLVETLLDASRMTSGRMQLEREELDLVALASDVVSRFRQEAQSAGCDLRLELDDEPIMGCWDRVRLDHALANLIANALKYGAGKPVTVSLSKREGIARLAVRDRGIGIAQADVSRIFGRFERAVSTRHYGGLGLGLFISHDIVEAHGGEILVSSRPHEGSEFTVILPTTIEEPHAMLVEERVQ
jgi:PAS domain S-box-containing protein